MSHLNTQSNAVQSGLAARELFSRLPNGGDYRVFNTPHDKLPGALANKDKRALAGFARRDVTKAIGTEFPATSGIQLSKLTDEQVEDLALLVAERGVVFFRDQDITDEQQQALGRKLGPLHVHPIGFAAPEKEELQTFAFDANSKLVAGEGWHADVSYETEPSSYAILKITEAPEVGGDTLWASTYAAYDTLTDSYKKIISGLEAYHTNAHVHYRGITEAALKDGFIQFYRRGPHTSLHPVVRTHPLTGWRSLNVNWGFTTQIKGFSKDESDSNLQFLYNHIKSSEDFKVRFRWEKNSVAIWDNRATQHEAVWDYWPESRKGVRVVSTGEKPYFDPKSKGQAESEGSAYKVSPIWRRSVL